MEGFKLWNSLYWNTVDYSSTSDFVFLRTLDDMICTNTALCSRVWDICVRVSLLLKHMMLFPVKSCCLHVYLFANKNFRDISHETDTSPFPPFPQTHLPVYFPQNRTFFFGFTALYIYLLLKVKYDCLIPVGVAVGPCVHWAAVNDDVFIWRKYTGPEVKQ